MPTLGILQKSQQRHCRQAAIVTRKLLQRLWQPFCQQSIHFRQAGCRLTTQHMPGIKATHHLPPNSYAFCKLERAMRSAWLSVLLEASRGRALNLSEAAGFQPQPILAILHIHTTFISTSLEGSGLRQAAANLHSLAPWVHYSILFNEAKNVPKVAQPDGNFPSTQCKPICCL